LDIDENLEHHNFIFCLFLLSAESRLGKALISPEPFGQAL
jgi:hypothetical protein